MNKQEVENALNQINDILSRQVDTGDIVSMMDKLNDMTAVMGLGARCVAASEALYAHQLRWAIDHATIESEKAGERKMIIEGYCTSELELNVKADRLYSALIHASENLRTLISYVKVEWQNSQKGTQP